MSGPLRPGPRRWLRVMLVAPFLVMLLLSAGYTTVVQRQADRRWCELLVNLDGAYQSEPPQTELGRQIGAAIHQLRQDFDC